MDALWLMFILWMATAGLWMMGLAEKSDCEKTIELQAGLIQLLQTSCDTGEDVIRKQWEIIDALKKEQHEKQMADEEAKPDGI